MKILHEDKHIIVIEKNQNCSVQGDFIRGIPLIDEVRDYFEFKMGIPDPYVGLVHRLDRHTGGIVVFAKTAQANRTLSAIFASHNLTKKYLALVEGAFTPDQGQLIDYLLIDSKLNKVQIVDKNIIGAKMAKLGYRVRSRHRASSGDFTALEIELFTGRQHQIRIQLSGHGYPIIGDVKYGSVWPSASKLSMALWATELRFDAFGIRYDLKSSPPESGVWRLLADCS